MNAFAAAAVKLVGGGVAATLLSVGVAGDLAQAAAAPSPKPSTAANPSATATHTARRAVARAVFEAEADVLGIKPERLRADLKAGQKVSDLAKDKGLTKEQFAAKLIDSVRPRLKALVDHHVITQAQADKVIDRITKGHIPFWDGIHLRK